MSGHAEGTGGGRAGPTVGIVGAGQLARMLGEAASELGVTTVVLAERADDAATAVAGHTVVGAADDRRALEELAARCDVVTLDHELVDLGLLAELDRRPGGAVRPGPGTLEAAVDKIAMRRRFDAAGLPGPAWAEVHGAADVERFAAGHGWPVVLKAARGGYDGKGVWPLGDAAEARSVVDAALGGGTPLLVEAMVPLEAELAALVARRPGGDVVAWPAVETAQVDGVCREVLVPGRLPADVRRAAADLGARVAEEVGSVGVLAVELFYAGGELLVNEIAARPHNSGHWTIEGATTSQFENHLRAVLDLPLGATDPTAPEVASVNVFGSAQAPDPVAALASALAVPGAHVHLYGKEPRPGRKLGHVTVTGSDPLSVRRRAWAAAVALGTPLPGGIEVDGLDAPAAGDGAAR